MCLAELHKETEVPSITNQRICGFTNQHSAEAVLGDNPDPIPVIKVSDKRANEKPPFFTVPKIPTLVEFA